MKTLAAEAARMDVPKAVGDAAITVQTEKKEETMKLRLTEEILKVLDEFTNAKCSEFAWSGAPGMFMQSGERCGGCEGGCWGNCEGGCYVTCTGAGNND